MHRLHKKLQREYIAELRPVALEVVAWWDAHCSTRWTEPTPPDAMSDFQRRWIAGPAAHPRIIAVFRKYFLAIDALNIELDDGDPNDDDGPAWGKDSDETETRYALPIDLLVNGLKAVAPDLHEIMQGMLFVPIGADPEGDIA
jgi:hypothetical protein